MQHIEFFHTRHFAENYYRVPPPAELARFVDFFWETRFDHLWAANLNGFSDVLFANIGYTYLLTLGSPYTMQVGERRFDMRTHGFLPRHQYIECHHQPGNRIFGIKFRISPVVFTTRVNFSEYREYIFPLSYLMEQKVLEQAQRAESFEERVNLLSRYFLSVTEKTTEEPAMVRVVSAVLEHCERENDYTRSVEAFANEHHISGRTLQRYFETCTGVNCKTALQLLRIRRAAEALSRNAAGFDYRDYGYYDYSHFHKHLKQFLQKPELEIEKPHLVLLAGTGKRLN